MADLGAIISIVSWGSKLSLELYKVASTIPWAAEDISDIARGVSNFSLTIKHVATLIKEYDHYPSAEAWETIQDVLEQCKAVYTEVEDILPIRDVRDDTEDESSIANRLENWNSSPDVSAKLEYLTVHLESLKSTLSVMLQALNTVQIVLWARTRPTISPQRAAKAVSNEEDQLETLIIEQQMSLLSASTLHETITESVEIKDPKLLMEEDSSQSLAMVEEQREPSILTPSQLFRFQDSSLTELDPSSTEVDRLSAVCKVSRARMDYILERWTRLEELEARIADEERKMEEEKRETQQPTVETDTDDPEPPIEKHYGPELLAPDPQRHTNCNWTQMDSPTLAIPVPANYHPNAPLSPASSYGVSPRTSGQLPLYTAPNANAFPQSPRSSIGTLPIDAAAAATAVAQAQDDDDDVNLGIPWRLCSRKYYWDFIDAKFQPHKSDSYPPPSQAYSDRNCWTEIMASWLDKEAIKEAGYKYDRISKERREGGRTKFDSCYRIHKVLTFPEVQHLVERTIELYQDRRSSTPDSKRERRRSSPPRDRPRRRSSQSSSYDRDQTPLANQVPRLERSSTSYPYPPYKQPPQPPHLDRTKSLPAPIVTYPLQPGHQAQAIHTPTSPNPHIAHIPAQSPQNYIPPPGYPAQPPPSYAAQPLYTPQSSTFPPPFSPTTNPRSSNPYIPLRHPLPTNPNINIPLKPNPTINPYPNQSLPTPTTPYFYNPVTYSSDSDSDLESGNRLRGYGARRSRKGSAEKERWKERDRREEREREKRKGKNSTVGTLAKVGGLAALLDGVLDLGVL